MNVFLPLIYAFNKSSEMGIDNFVPSIFLGPCNFKCPYCMNASLAMGKTTKTIDLEIVKQHVIDNQSEWLNISGGEPTFVPYFNLMVLLGEVLSWKCKIGMATNGGNPNALNKILKYLNYVAVDLKAYRKQDYEKISDFPELDYELILDSICIIRSEKEKRNDFNFEIRTTLYPPFIDTNIISYMGKEIIKKDDTWILQQFRHSKNMIDDSCREILPYNNEYLEEIKKEAEVFCNNVVLRYV